MEGKDTGSDDGSVSSELSHQISLLKIVHKGSSGGQVRDPWLRKASSLFTFVACFLEAVLYNWLAPLGPDAHLPLLHAV